MPRAANEVNLDALRFFITWAQIPEDELATTDTVAEFLHEFHDGDNWVEVCEEFHQDDGRHFHAVVVFDRRYRGTMASFDFAGRHPNIIPIKNGTSDLARTRKYLRKDGGEFAFRGPVPDYVAPTERHSWGELLRSPDAGSFLVNASQWFPKEYILRYHELAAFAQHHFNAPSTYVPEFPRESFVVPAEADDWVAQCLGEVSIFRTSRLVHTNLL